MMKCPKCGSEMEFGWSENIHWYKCHNKLCDQKLIWEEYFEKVKRQARLEKVLSKFEQNKNNEYVMQFPNVLCDDGKYHLIYYYEEKFRLYRDDNIIQLDTVELLLRDLGVDL